MIRRQGPSAKLSLAAFLVTIALGFSGGAIAGPARQPAFIRVNSLGVGTYPTYAQARAKNGTLFLVYQTTTGKSPAPTGLAVRSISAAGKLGPENTVLKGWGTSVPGLVALPDGSLEAVFGATSPKPGQISDLWSVTSNDGGKTWSKPAQVGAGEQGTYGANIRAEQSGTTTDLSLSVAGGITVQRGLGSGSPSASITTGADNFAGDVDSALDAASKQMVVSWDSNAHSGGNFIKGATGGPTAKLAGQTRNEVVISGRDSGPGVYAAFTTDGTHVKLARYGGGSVAVGSVSGITAKVLGTATGLDGRIWVFWGDEGGGLAVTRSNKAVTKFETIQKVNPQAFSLYRIGGDGRLGPLDLLVEMIPNSSGNVAGTFYTRVLPILSDSTKVVAVKRKSGTVTGHELTVTVSDAGDAVPGATVTVKGSRKKTDAKGRAELTLPVSMSGTIQITIAAPGYQTLTAQASV